MTREYFDEHERKIKQLIVIGDIYYRKAMFYNYLYKFTGLKWAKERNQYYVREGQKLLIGGLGIAVFDIAILENYIRSFGE